MRTHSRHSQNVQSLHYPAGRGPLSHITRSLVQTNLAVNTPGDRFDQEADRVADQVLRMQPSGSAGRPRSTTTETLRGAITPHRQMRKDSLRADVAQAKPNSLIGGRAPKIGPIDIAALRGRGQPMARSERQFFEPRLGVDFSNVRIHSDRHAADAARSMNAHAFTVGRNVVFGDQYRPGTDSGKRLMAHELTHVVQQNAGAPLSVQRKTKNAPCAVHVFDNSDPKDKAVIPKKAPNAIGVSSVGDMTSKVNKYINSRKNSCKCVSRLEINGHGTDGYQSVGNGSLYIKNGKALIHNSKKSHLRKLKAIKFCGRGMLLLMGCHTGRGKGKTLLKRISGILPGILIGGAQHFTHGTGLGGKKVVGEDDKTTKKGKVAEPEKSKSFLKSPYVNWHLTIRGKEYVITGKDVEKPAGKSKLRAAEKVKVKTPEGELIKIK